MKPHILLIDLYTWQFQIEWQILLATKLSAVQQPWHSSLIAGKKVIDQDGYLTADEGIFVRLLPFSKQNMVFFIVLSTKLFNLCAFVTVVSEPKPSLRWSPGQDSCRVVFPSSTWSRRGAPRRWDDAAPPPSGLILYHVLSPAVTLCHGFT